MKEYIPPPDTIPLRVAPKLCPNRDHQHGGVEAVGAVEQPIKDAFRAGRNWDRLTPGQKCALDMIAHKLGRILSGADPGDPEHWEDLAGYPTAAMRAKE